MKTETLTTYTLAGIGAVEGVWKYYVRPEITAKRTWAAIGALVLAHEIACPRGQLLSEGADRAIAEHPWIPAAGALLAGHVLNLIPEQWDPIHQASNLLKGEV